MAAYTDEMAAAKGNQARTNRVLWTLLARFYVAGSLHGSSIVGDGDFHHTSAIDEGNWGCGITNKHPTEPAGRLKAVPTRKNTCQRIDPQDMPLLNDLFPAEDFRSLLSFVTSQEVSERRTWTAMGLGAPTGAFLRQSTTRTIARSDNASEPLTWSISLQLRILGFIWAGSWNKWRGAMWTDSRLDSSLRFNALPEALRRTLGGEESKLSSQ